MCKGLGDIERETMGPIKLDMLPEVAVAYPNVKFLQIDSCPFGNMKPNIYCSVFREYEASYLTGAEAALTTSTGKVGAISALDIPFLHRYTDGFIAGAKQVKAMRERSGDQRGVSEIVFSEVSGC